MAASTRSRVSASTTGEPLATRGTVIGETRATAATSTMDGPRVRARRRRGSSVTRTSELDGGDLCSSLPPSLVESCLVLSTCVDLVGRAKCSPSDGCAIIGGARPVAILLQERVDPGELPRAVTPRLRGRPRRSWVGWAFVAPFLMVFVFAVIAPIGYATYLSLYREQLVGGRKFVGLDNLVDALKESQLHAAFGRVGVILLIQVPVMIVLAAAVALAIDSGRLAGARLFRISVFLPYAVPGVIATLMWGFMYGDQFGLVKSINNGLGW